MRIRVFEGPASRSLPVVLVKIGAVGGRVDLYVVEEDGNWRGGGHIATLSSAGLYLKPNIDPEIGLPLDGMGRIKLVEGP